MVEKIVKSKLNEGRVSLKGFEDRILEPLSKSLGIKVRKGETKKSTQGYSTTVTSRFYEFGNLNVMTRDIKVPGMGADNVEAWIIDQDDSTKGQRFHSGWGDYEDFIKAIKEKVSNNAPDKPVRQRQWTRNEVDQLLKTLNSDLEHENMSDVEAFDIAGGILRDEDGLENWIKDQGIKDPLGWLADRI